MENLNKYQNGKIYKIVDLGYTKCYIGSTIDSLSKRMAKHRQSSNPTSSKSLFDEFGKNNCKIELIETYPCNSKDELKRREGFFIQAIECVNKRVEGRTRVEYYRDNQDSILENKHQYYEENKEKAKTYSRECTVSHKEQISEMKKQYYNANKNDILEKQKVKMTCICGSTFRNHDKSRHEKSKKHLTFTQTSLCN